MRTLRRLGVVAATLALGGCFQSSTLLKVDADGSGTIEQRTIMTAAALAQLRQFGGAFGNADDKKIDPFSEEDARRVATEMGEGVTFVSSTPIASALGEGHTTVYAFQDITKIRVKDASSSQLPRGAHIPDTDVVSQKNRDFEAGLTHTRDGNALLTLHMPGQRVESLLQARGPDSGKPIKPSDLAMFRQMFSGLRMAIQVEPAGRVVRTNSRYVDGQTVTLFDIDLDEFLRDEVALNRFQAANSLDEVSAVLKDVRGLKVTPDTEITIEFTPTR